MTALEQIDAAWDAFLQFKIEHAHALDMGAVIEMMEDEIYEKECELRFLVPQDVYRRYLELGSVGFRAEVEQQDADRIAAAEAEEDRRVELLRTALDVSVDLAGAGFPRSQIARVQSPPDPTFAEASEFIRAYLSARILEIQRDERFSDLVRGFELTTCPVSLMSVEQLTEIGTELQTLADEIAAASDDEQIRQEELDAASPTPFGTSTPPQPDRFAAHVEASRQGAIAAIEREEADLIDARRWVEAAETEMGRPLREMSAEELHQLHFHLMMFVLGIVGAEG